MRSTRLAFLLSLFLLSSFLPAGAEEPREKNTAVGAGRKWAFCVGVGKYTDPLIPPLSTASKDAAEIAKVLEEHGGFDEIFLLSDGVGGKDPRFPYSRNILAALNRAAASIRPSDLVVFSYSGSGCIEETGRSFLLTPESRTGNLEETAIPLETILEFIRKTGAKRSLLLLDAARPGIQYKGKVSTWAVYPDRYLKRGVSAVFYAAGKGYTSNIDEKSEHTAFMAQLLRGLEGEADKKYGGNKDGVVTITELASYVQLSLSEWCIATSRHQVPWMEILDKGQSEMVLSTVEKTRVAKAKIPYVSFAEQLRKSEAPKKGTVIAPAAQQKKPTVGAPTVGAPAPKLDDLAKGAGTVPKTGEAKDASAKGKEDPAPPGAVRESSGEKVKVVFVERAPAPPMKNPETKPLSTVEKEAPSTVQSQGGPGEIRKPVEGVALVSREEKRKAVQLRFKARNVSAEEMKSILTGFGFYSTCLNYNGEFCNPSGDFENHFNDNGDGTVSDRATGLMWEKGGSREGLSWASAREYAQRANRERLAGHADWRVPTVEELASLMESSWKNENLFIDPVFDRTQRQCWSIDTKGTESAWKANFIQGLFTDFPIHSLHHVKLVRTLQVRPSTKAKDEQPPRGERLGGS